MTLNKSPLKNKNDLITKNENNPDCKINRIYSLLNDFG